MEFSPSMPIAAAALLMTVFASCAATVIDRPTARTSATIHALFIVSSRVFSRFQGLPAFRVPPGPQRGTGLGALHYVIDRRLAATPRFEQRGIQVPAAPLRAMLFSRDDCDEVWRYVRRGCGRDRSFLPDCR